jgi:transcriptional regulator with XRE-family HTH domain
VPDRHRRRAGPARLAGRKRGGYLAQRIGIGLKESRTAIRLIQAEAADRAGVSQGFWSLLERGGAAIASLETLAACAAAVDTQLAAFVEAVPGADLPRDMSTCAVSSWSLSLPRLEAGSLGRSARSTQWPADRARSMLRSNASHVARLQSSRSWISSPTEVRQCAGWPTRLRQSGETPGLRPLPACSFFDRRAGIAASSGNSETYSGDDSLRPQPLGWRHFGIRHVPCRTRTVLPGQASTAAGWWQRVSARAGEFTS